MKVFLLPEVNSSVFQEDPLFQQFVILVSAEGLENKYQLELSRGESGCGLVVMLEAHRSLQV